MLAAVKGLPLLKVTPVRTVQVQTVLLALGVAEVRRLGNQVLFPPLAATLTDLS